jgi:hypothetical protein
MKVLCEYTCDYGHNWSLYTEMRTPLNGLKTSCAHMGIPLWYCRNHDQWILSILHCAQPLSLLIQ